MMRFVEHVVMTLAGIALYQFLKYIVTVQIRERLRNRKFRRYAESLCMCNVAAYGHVWDCRNNHNHNQGHTG